MKKLTVVTTALLCSFLAYSQEVDVRLIPRIDVNCGVPAAKDGAWSVDFGNTSFYTLVEGSFLDNFSYSIANHWLSVYDGWYQGEGYVSGWSDTGGLYTNTLYSSRSNWLDWVNLTYTLETENAGSFEFTAGKFAMAIGSFEIDANDYDSHFTLSSYYWNYVPGYQWGGHIAYITPDGTTSIGLEATTSPYGGMMFRRGDRQYGAYALRAGSELDWFSSIWTVNFVQYDRNSYVNLIALGNQFYIGDLTIGIDWMNRASSAKHFFNQEMSLSGTLSYNFGDRVELVGTAGWERFPRPSTFNALAPFFEEELPGHYLFGGIGVNWYPLKDSRDLRFHALVSSNNTDACVYAGVGLTYNFSVYSK